MQPLLLLDENEGCIRTEGNGKSDNTDYEADDAVHEDETEDGSTDGTCRPCDVTPLDAHELQRFLESLEHRVAHVFAVCHSCCHDVFLC